MVKIKKKTKKSLQEPSSRGKKAANENAMPAFMKKTKKKIKS